MRYIRLKHKHFRRQRIVMSLLIVAAVVCLCLGLNSYQQEQTLNENKEEIKWNL